MWNSFSGWRSQALRIGLNTKRKYLINNISAIRSLTDMDLTWSIRQISKSKNINSTHTWIRLHLTWLHTFHSSCINPSLRQHLMTLLSRSTSILYRSQTCTSWSLVMMSRQPSTTLSWLRLLSHSFPARWSPISLMKESSSWNTCNSFQAWT